MTNKDRTIKAFLETNKENLLSAVYKSSTVCPPILGYKEAPSDDYEKWTHLWLCEAKRVPYAGIQTNETNKEN